MVIAIAALELLPAIIAFVMIGFGNDDVEQGAFPLEAWLVWATLQVTIHFISPKRRPRVSRWLWLIAALLLVASLALESVWGFRFPHQALFIAAVAWLPQLVWDRFAKTTTDRDGTLGMIGLFSLPLAFFVWSYMNILIVKLEVWRVTRGVPYCIFVSRGELHTGGYRQVLDIWDLSGWRMISARGSGGSGNCCQWDFHAVLATQPDELFNWSYRGQRFDKLSKETRRALGLDGLICHKS